MDVRVTYTAIGAAVLFGALSAGLFVENTQLRVQLHTETVSRGGHQQADTAAKTAVLKKLFSGATPPGEHF